MDKEFDLIVNKLQQQIFDETKKAIGELGFDRWRHPRYRGKIEDPDGYARIKGKCGDTMEIFLKFEDSRVRTALYQTDGCIPSQICGSFAAEMAMGKDPDELLDITGEAILLRLGRFPREEEHCAFLAAEAVQMALNSFMEKKAERTQPSTITVKEGE